MSPEKRITIDEVEGVLNWALTHRESNPEIFVPIGENVISTSSKTAESEGEAIIVTVVKGDPLIIKQNAEKNRWTLSCSKKHAARLTKLGIVNFSKPKK